MARESLTDMALLNKSSKGVSKPACDDEKSILGRKNSRCQGPEVRTCLVSVINSEEASVAGAWEKERRGRKRRQRHQG